MTEEDVTEKKKRMYCTGIRTHELPCQRRTLVSHQFNHYDMIRRCGTLEEQEEGEEPEEPGAATGLDATARLWFDGYIT